MRVRGHVQGPRPRPLPPPPPPPRTHLLLGLAVLPLAGLLLDVRRHGEGGAVMAVGQVDDVGDGRQHGALAAGADDGVTLAHRQQELGTDRRTQSERQPDIRTHSNSATDRHTGVRDFSVKYEIKKG